MSPFRLFRATALILGLAATPIAAQDLPAYASTVMNDWADLLDQVREDELAAEIQSMRDETGIEMVVVTLPSRTPFGWDQLEPFATALFNDWGVGDATRNDGIMVLVLRDDREMRIELGAGYGPGFNRVAQSIVDTDFLPAFRNGDLAGGLIDGTRATITEIARPFAKGTPANPPSALRENLPVIAFFVVLGAFFLTSVFAAFKDQFTRFQRCPVCGQRALHVTRETTIPATGDAPGEGERHITCSNCSYDRRETYKVPSRSRSSSGGSFGGGSSSGGGASGRW